MRAHQVGEDLRALLPHDRVPFIKKLPPELLLRIFEIGTEDDDSEHHRDRMPDHRDSDTHNDSIDVLTEREDKGRRGGNAPDLRLPFEIVVSHVCRHWRVVTLSSPSLWTTIVVGPDARPPYEYVSTLLERSKDLPIDIFVDCVPPEAVGFHRYSSCWLSNADVKLLYSLLIHHIHRWRTIQVSVSKYIHVYEFLTAFSHPFISTASRLTTLKLDYDEEAINYESRPHSFSRRFEPKPLILAGLSAPCLSRIVLCGVYVDYDQPWIASASRLKSLELTYLPGDTFPSRTQFSTILRGAPELEKLSLRKFPPRGNPIGRFTQPFPGSLTGPNAPIQLLKLTNLVLGFQSVTYAVGILRKLNLYIPALKHLTLHFHQGDYTRLIDELTGQTIKSTSPTSSLERSRNSLNHLECFKIAGILPSLGCFRRLCADLQCLTLLNVSVPHLSRAYLGVLSDPCTSLPRLTTLYISRASGKAIRKLVQKRSKDGTPLEELYVGESCVVNNKDLDWLKNNVKTFSFFKCGDNWDIDNSESDDLEDSGFEDSDDAD